MPEYQQFWHNTQLNIDLMHAQHIEFAYPRHSHDYYVLCLIEQGVQSFTHKGSKYYTPPNGLILINPGVVHTGEAATEHGFILRSLYPNEAHMQAISAELMTGQSCIPYFSEVRVDDELARQKFLALHQCLKQDANPLAIESHFIATMTYLIKRYANMSFKDQKIGAERRAVSQARHYIEAHFSERVSLNELAKAVALSPYYLLRVFHSEVGMPPHAYLQDVRIRQAQKLIEAGKPLADIAVEVGYSSQSHLTRNFKQIVGLTPGRYAAQLRASQATNLSRF